MWISRRQHLIFIVFILFILFFLFFLCRLAQGLGLG